MGVELSVVVLSDRHPVPAFLADVRTAEAAGVRAVWVYDHLTWPRLGDGPWYGAVPLLAAAAAATERVGLGTLVATPNFRHPVPFATELVTLDQLTGGRLDIGVGAGAPGPDAVVLGDAPRGPGARMDRFTEWLGLLDQLLREPETTVHGPRYSAVQAHQLPGCVQQPRAPFTVAASGPRGLELVARYGASWVSYGPASRAPAGAPEWFTGLAAQSAQLTETLERHGRQPDELRRIALVGLDDHELFSSAERYADALGRLAEAGFTEIALHWVRPDGAGVPSSALEFVLAAHAT